MFKVGALVTPRPEYLSYSTEYMTGTCLTNTQRGEVLRSNKSETTVKWLETGVIATELPNNMLMGVKY